MPLTSYSIGSPVYIAPSPSVKVSAGKIARENIVSMQGLKNTVTSYGYGGDNSPYTFTVDGQPYGIHKTSNKTWISSLRHGNFSPQVDDTMGFASWKAAGEKYGPNSFEYVNLPASTMNSGVISSFRQSPAHFEIGDTSIPKYVTGLYISDTHLNKTGKRVSEIENLRQHLTRYYGTEIAAALADKAIKEGESLEEISYIGAGHLPKGAAYGVNRTRDGRIIVLAGNSYDAIAKAARSWGVDVWTYLETIFAEEGQHIIRKSFDKPHDAESWIEEERKTKDDVYNALSDMAEGAKGDPRPRHEHKRRRIKRMAEIKRNDRDTVERYRELVKELAMEAEEKGLKGGSVHEYVEGRLYQMTEETEAKPKMSNLERIAEEGSGEARREAPQESEAPA